MSAVLIGQKSSLAEFESGYCCGLSLVVLLRADDPEGLFHLMSLVVRKMDRTVRYEEGLCFRVRLCFCCPLMAGTYTIFLMPDAANLF
jgi:hypothetical protein